MLATTAPYIAVIDADLQHDETLLPQMLDTLKRGDSDIVVGSRYAPGGDVGDWDARRARMSRLAVRLSRLVVPAELTDPMSGFFMMRRAVLDDSVRKLSAIGFKILADLFASHRPPLRFSELAYKFRARHAGGEQARFGDGVGLRHAAARQDGGPLDSGALSRLLHRRRRGPWPCTSRCSPWSSRACTAASSPARRLQPCAPCPSITPSTMS